MEEASEESQRIEEKVAEFLGQYHIFCAPADARSKLYELKNLLQEYERLKTRAARSDAAREEFDNTRNELLKFGEEAGIDFGEDIAAGLSRLQMKATEYRLASRKKLSLKKNTIWKNFRALNVVRIHSMS